PAPWDKPGDSWQDKAIAQIEAEEAELAADPVKAEAARRAKMICMCKSVDLGAIEDAITQYGLTTVEGVREKTNASGGCGACSLKIEEIFEAGDIVGLPTESHTVAFSSEVAAGSREENASKQKTRAPIGALAAE